MSWHRFLNKTTRIVRFNFKKYQKNPKKKILLEKGRTLSIVPKKRENFLLLISKY
jgi:hypothetical protein